MRISKVSLLAAAIACVSGLACSATDTSAQVSDDVVKIGVLTDMTGFLSDIAGPGAVLAVRMAVSDFGGQVLGKPIEVVAADNANKADVAANLARNWFDTQNVDMITDLGNSATGLASVNMAAQKNKIAMAVAPGTSRITNEECTPTSVHYAYDTYALAKGTATTLVNKGLDSWYFVTIDFAGGIRLRRTRPRSSGPAAARYWVRRAIRPTPATFLPTSSRHKPRRQRLSASRPQVRLPSMR